ncbi:glycosyltransferase family 31 protein [Mixia osmundae IAM 14324]|uniref:Glycosyltransferase family 31 protein n=1 Tax=Mixia osmundae (strain CBS 9802 / IAM 14324 / JCM 22182 / KY 12970) TaxID=764103 RepID=G7DZ49_MIXOS|nr:glycosyltransferase family 31 protein [Mixia osmundae IAM 14324]KEI38259.1 glycosyltransferase family 31 protein [Mixia osmundae IAM 14324]GAA95859.1 hypothetical protein E5Q_02516 [Mixia osmundae IAM 14324]
MASRRSALPFKMAKPSMLALPALDKITEKRLSLTGSPLPSPTLSTARTRRHEQNRRITLTVATLLAITGLFLLAGPAWFTPHHAQDSELKSPLLTGAGRVQSSFTSAGATLLHKTPKLKIPGIMPIALAPKRRDGSHVSIAAALQVKAEPYDITHPPSPQSPVPWSKKDLMPVSGTGHRGVGAVDETHGLQISAYPARAILPAGAPSYKDLMFAVATTPDRALQYLPLWRYWLKHGSPCLLAFHEKDRTRVKEVTAKMAELSVECLVIYNQLERSEHRTFGNIREMHEFAKQLEWTPTWFIQMDDDTIWLDLRSLRRNLARYSPKEDYLLGSTSEGEEQKRIFNFMGFGGAGLIMSTSLLDKMAAKWKGCYEVVKSEFGGDGMINKCAKMVMQRDSLEQTVTVELGMHQMDFRGDPSGFYQSGMPFLTLHHVNAAIWGPPIPKEYERSMFEVTELLLQAAEALGGDNFGRRYMFADGKQLMVVGYSLTEYSHPLTPSDLQSVEHTYDADLLFPQRPKIREALVPWSQKQGKRTYFISRVRKLANGQVLLSFQDIDRVDIHILWDTTGMVKAAQFRADLFVYQDPAKSSEIAVSRKHIEEEAIRQARGIRLNAKIRPITQEYNETLVAPDADVFWTDEPLLTETQDDGDRINGMLSHELPVFPRVPRLDPQKAPTPQEIFFSFATSVDRLIRFAPLWPLWLHAGSPCLIVLDERERPRHQEAVDSLRRYDLRCELLYSPSPRYEHRVLGSVVFMRKETQRHRLRIKWYFIADDDTCIFSIDGVRRMLEKYDPRKMLMIGNTSEGVEQAGIFGIMAFGGSGIVLSKPLLDAMAREHDKYLSDKNDSMNIFGGDEMITRCASMLMGLDKAQALTRESSLHQFDLRGNPAGFLQAGLPILTIHHTTASNWAYAVPSPGRDPFQVIGVLQRAAIFLGPDTLFRRYVFGDGKHVMTAGYSIVEYRHNLTPDDMTKMEKTYANELMWVSGRRCGAGIDDIDEQVSAEGEHSRGSCEMGQAKQQALILHQRPAFARPLDGARSSAGHSRVKSLLNRRETGVNAVAQHVDSLGRAELVSARNI